VYCEIFAKTTLAIQEKKSYATYELCPDVPVGVQKIHRLVPNESGKAFIQPV